MTNIEESCEHQLVEGVHYVVDRSAPNIEKLNQNIKDKFEELIDQKVIEDIHQQIKRPRMPEVVDLYYDVEEALKVDIMPLIYSEVSKNLIKDFNQ
jgi:hypothetical protein